MDNIIPIIYIVSEKYAPYLGVSIESLTENLDISKKYEINIIHENLHEKTKEKIQNINKENLNIYFIELKEIASILKYENIITNVDYESLSLFSRVFFSDVFKKYDKAIYIDSDTIILDDISKLYDYDIKDNYIGAVKDESISDIDSFANYIENYLGINRYEYVNVGVMLLNLKKLREERFSRKYIDVYYKYGLDSVFPVQDYLNVLCKNRIYFLPYKWNTMPAEGKTKVDMPNIIHYNLYRKPWHYDNVEYDSYFWHYAKKSEFYSLIEDIKNGFTASDRENDMVKYKSLEGKANRLCEKSISLKSLPYCDKLPVN